MLPWGMPDGPSNGVHIVWRQHTPGIWSHGGNELSYAKHYWYNMVFIYDEGKLKSNYNWVNLHHHLYMRW